jgi:hypothetical protein
MENNIEQEVNLFIRELPGVHSYENNVNWYKGREENLTYLAMHAAELQKQQMNSQILGGWIDKIYPTKLEDVNGDLPDGEYCIDGDPEIDVITNLVKSGKLKMGDKVKVLIVKYNDDETMGI